LEKILYRLECYLKKRISRRDFLHSFFVFMLAFIAENAFLKAAFAKSRPSEGRPGRDIRTEHDLVVSYGKDPYSNTVNAIEKLGGIRKFVRSGDKVVVKPNIAWDRTPEQAANTDPGVVAAIVELCYSAGAARVSVFDITCNNEKLCYDSSGIAEAARRAGASVFFPDHWNTVKAEFPYESPMQGWPILRDAVEADTFINVPILKHHGLTGLTLSMKNLMGVCSGTRGLIHVNIGRKLADLTDFIRPELTVIDATRVLERHGPSGGSLDDVVRMDRIIASTDPVLADSYAASITGRAPLSINYIAEASKRGLGKTDLAKADILKTDL
jgi:uncharacterized protein (DUF362 family)